MIRQPSARVGMAILSFVYGLLLGACAQSPLTSREQQEEELVPGSPIVVIAQAEEITEYRINPQNGVVAKKLIAKDDRSSWKGATYTERESRRVQSKLAGLLTIMDESLLWRPPQELVPSLQNTGKRYSFRQPAEWSPDRKRLVVTVEKHFDGVAYLMVVFDRETKAVIAQHSFGDRYVTDLAWSPDGQSIAVTVQSEEIGMSGAELRYAIAGHPIPYNSLYLDVVKLKGGSVRSFPLLSNVKFGTRGFVLWE